MEYNERPGLKWGSLMQSYRNQAQMTQEDLANASGEKRTYIGSIEFGRIGIPSVKTFRALHRVLRFPGWEMLEAIGYPTDATDDNVIPSLLSVCRSLPEPKQELLAQMGRLMLRDEPPAA